MLQIQWLLELASSAAKVLQMQLRCKSIFAQKSSRSTSFRAQQKFDDDDGWKGETAFQQSAPFISAHTGSKSRENWKILVKIHTEIMLNSCSKLICFQRSGIYRSLIVT